MIKTLLYFGAILLAASVQAQSQQVIVVKDAARDIVHIQAGGKPFTDFVFTDTMEKPFLYPIYAPDGQTITRGFPWHPEPGDPTDHPHHIGLWLNYENVNGLDFWNNSFAIPAAKKSKYGWIRTQAVTQMKSGRTGLLAYNANWTNQAKDVLLTEETTFHFSATDRYRVIDRITTLTAVQDVNFPDAKDGMLGLRIAHELELPVKKATEYKDDKGNVTKVMATLNEGVTGNYITSEGRTGDEAWASRGTWCMLYGKKGGDSISILIIDHPKNPGYPTYWHARNYGLFAANPLGQGAFSKGKETMNFHLAKGQSVQFRYRIVIASGSAPLSEKEREALVKSFR